MTVFDDARCRFLTPEEADSVFFAPENEDTAKALCCGCPARAACEQIGLQFRVGVFGGLTAQERAELNTTPTEPL